MMRCTVITPCYNPGKYLSAMLESVAAQGDCVARHIVMDGGSTDGTVERLVEWAKTHPYFEFRSEKDNGQSHACQKALEMVDTEYFCWLNADDKLLDGALVALMAKAESCEKRPAIVYGDYIRIDGDDKVIAVRRQPTFNYWDCLHGYLTVQNVAAIFNTSILKEQGGFDITLRFVMDYDLVLKLSTVGLVKHLKRFCGAFRLHSTSKTTTMDDVRKEETEIVRTKYGVMANKVLRHILALIVKMRVGLRMAMEGCFVRVYEAGK